MNYKNRIVRTGEAFVDQIMFNPDNWRIHPKQQQDSLTGILEEIGWVQMVLINEQTGNLVDGHLRVQLANKANMETVPAIYINVSPEEEKTILASLDPIGSMAATDKEKLKELLDNIETENQAIENFINQMNSEYGLKLSDENDSNLLDIVNFEMTEPKTQVNARDVFYLGEHVLLCASTIYDVSFWLPFVNEKNIFIPYATPYVLLSEQAKSLPFIALNPEPFICGHIVDRWIEINGEDSVTKQG